MKISLRDLEAARSNPRGFSGRPGGFYRMSKQRILQLAALEFHRRHEDSNAANAYFQQHFRKNFKNTTDLPFFEAQLARYCQQFISLGMAVAAIKPRISMPISSRMEIVGEVPRLDLASDGGYAAWLFGKQQVAWRGELRWPMLQRYFATSMGVSVSLVSVGMYFFEAGIYERTRYSDTEIVEASAECRRIGRNIS
jgi:hypothetical protein